MRLNTSGKINDGADLLAGLAQHITLPEIRFEVTHE